MVLPIACTLLLVGYVILDLVTSGTLTSLALAPVLICFVWQLWDIRRNQEIDGESSDTEFNEMMYINLEQQKEIAELKKMIKKLLPEDGSEEDGSDNEADFSSLPEQEACDNGEKAD